MMNRRTIEELANEFLTTSPLALVSEEAALEPRLAGMRIFEKVVTGVASAGDEMLRKFTQTPEAGVYFDPQFWVPGALSIMSFFLPFTEEVRKSNAAIEREPSPEWLHARIEGQKFLDAMSEYLVDEMELSGHFAIAPSVDFRFYTEDAAGENGELRILSNWSERHVAFAAGLGTFGLSKGIITKSGMAGRFTSIISTVNMEATPRDYTALYEYCTSCLSCLKNCPAGAITKENGKDHGICREYIRDYREKHAKDYGYGCGKCQTDVPCETCAPGRS